MSTETQKYCRFCAELKLDADILDLTVYPNIQLEVQEKLTIFNVNVVNLSTEDSLPKTICGMCNNKLNSAHEFILQTELSQTLLLSLFGSKINSDHASSLKIKQEFHAEEFDIILDGKESDVEDLDYAKARLNTADGVNKFYDTFTQPKLELDVKIEEVADHSWASYTWLCKHCDVTFPNITLLRDHSKHKHKICFAFKCADCNEAHDKFDAFVEHARGHRLILRDYCEYCNLKLEDATRADHMSSHPLICRLCGQTFQFAHALKAHMTRFTPFKNPNVLEGKYKKIRKRTKQVYVLPGWEIEKIQDKSWTGYTWSCQFCDSVFASVDEIRLHTKTVHGKCFGIKCVDCNEILDGYRGFVYHVRRHRPFLRNHCHYCNHKFAETETENQHVTQHFSEDNRQCDGCGEIFHDRNLYLHHTNTYKPAKPKPLPYKKRERPVNADDLICDICSKEFKCGNSLRIHKVLHSERNKDFTCDKCGKAYYSKSSLVAHSYVHDEIDSEVCEICRKSFKTLNKLKRHVMTHSTEKPYQCGVCYRRFKFREQMANHQIVHSNVMPYQCQYCEKAFKHKNNLKTHENQHTGARPYTCADCGMEFTNWSNCNKHMKRKHGTTLAKSVLTPQGKVPLHPKSLKPKKLKDPETTKEWTEQILAPLKRGKKPVV